MMNKALEQFRKDRPELGNVEKLIFITALSYSFEEVLLVDLQKNHGSGH